MSPYRNRTAKAAKHARGSMLLEASMGMGLAAMLSLLLMKAYLLSIGGNQWTIMQSLTDAYLTRETALANRIPLADLTAAASAWPDLAADDPPHVRQTVTLGKLPGGRVVQGELTRFRTNETRDDEPETRMLIWRVHSVLTYQVGEHEYVKSRSIVRMQ